MERKSSPLLAQPSVHQEAARGPEIPIVGHVLDHAVVTESIALHPLLPRHPRRRLIDRARRYVKAMTLRIARYAALLEPRLEHPKRK